MSTKVCTGYGIKGNGGWFWAANFGESSSSRWTKRPSVAMHYASAKQAMRVMRYQQSAHGYNWISGDAKVVKFIKRGCPTCGRVS